MLSQEHRGNEATNPGDCMDDYMAWYSRISRHFIGLVTIQKGGDASQQSTIDVDDDCLTYFFPHTYYKVF